MKVQSKVQNSSPAFGAKVNLSSLTGDLKKAAQKVLPKLSEIGDDATFIRFEEGTNLATNPLLPVGSEGLAGLSLSNDFFAAPTGEFFVKVVKGVNTRFKRFLNSLDLLPSSKMPINAQTEDAVIEAAQSAFKNLNK